MAAFLDEAFRRSSPRAPLPPRIRRRQIARCHLDRRPGASHRVGLPGKRAKLDVRHFQIFGIHREHLLVRSFGRSMSGTWISISLRECDRFSDCGPVSLILETAMGITAEYADDADSRICERRTGPAELTHWVNARSAARPCPSASIRKIRGSISEFWLIHRASPCRSCGLIGASGACALCFAYNRAAGLRRCEGR